MDTEKIETALRKARKYIRTVESLRRQSFVSRTEFERNLRLFAEGNEIKAIEDALLELGVIV